MNVMKGYMMENKTEKTKDTWISIGDAVAEIIKKLESDRRALRD